MTRAFISGKLRVLFGRSLKAIRRRESPSGSVASPRELHMGVERAEAPH